MNHERVWLALVIASSFASLIISLYAGYSTAAFANVLASSSRPANHSEFPQLSATRHTSYTPGYKGYVGSDYPRTWPIGPLDTVHMPVEDTVHYAIDADIGVSEWTTTLPNNSGIIYLGQGQRPFSISLFHELRCLDILRVELESQLHHLGESTGRTNQTGLVSHCMGYIRQMLICRGDTRLESVKAISGLSVSNSDVTHTCKDWTAVFQAAEANVARSQG
jgi:hypothetical protein